MCDRNDCGVCNRVDAEVRDDSELFISKITYRGEWAVFTEDNVLLPYMIMLGKPFLPYMTLLLKVGDKAIGEKMDDKTLKSSVYDGYFSDDIDKAINQHDMMVYGLESGLLNPTELVSPYEVISRY